MTERRQPARARRGVALMWLNVAVFILSAAAIAASATFLAHRPALRAQLDSTKTRAYSLSEQSLQLISSLEGQWTIALVYVEAEIDRATLRQVREVLSRFDEASDNVDVERIDPTDPASVQQYERLLTRLRGIYADEVGRYEHDIDEGTAAYADLQRFAAAQVTSLERHLQTLDPNSPVHRDLTGARTVLGVFANNIGAVLERIDAAMEFSEAQPIPDYEEARDVLVAALTQAATSLNDIARTFEDRMGDRTGITTATRAFLATARRDVQQRAEGLQKVADPLIHLEPLALTRIGRELERGEAAVVVGPRRAAVIPAAQVLPRANLRATEQGGISFDRRFRGEQLIASAIRSLVVEQMPMVVFVHAQSESMLEPREPNRLDMLGVAALLKAAQYDVQEWSVVGGQQPAPAEGQPVVWVVVPPPFSERTQRAFEVPREEQVLVDMTRMLLSDGQSVLLPLYPSAVHRFQQEDPWEQIAASLGVDADTSQILTHRVVSADGESQLARNVQLLEPGGSHAVSSAVYGQQLIQQLPLRVEPLPDASAEASVEIVLSVDGDGELWFDPDWTRPREADAEIDPSWIVQDSVGLAAAVTRDLPRNAGQQRAIVVGSVDWMFTALADAVVDLGGGRVALLYPGNLEFMQAAVAWLAGMDELIARTPTSQQVARIEGLGDTARDLWRWAIAGGMPLACLILGVCMWLWRK